MRYFLELSYLGKAYHGWQVQLNAPSVQECLQGVLSTVLRCKTDIVGAGRTDTGVHASCYVVHFDTDELICDGSKFCHKLNSVLPRDIAARRLRSVREDAHARFGALSREYKYYISKEKNPFCSDQAYVWTLPLDVEAMNRAAQRLIEVDDFTSFCKLHSDNKTNICSVTTACWVDLGDKLIFTIRADRFLRNMVRAIVGTLLDVGRGKISVEGFDRVIEGRNRSLASTSAPAHGLFLTGVDYPAEFYLDEETV